MTSGATQPAATLTAAAPAAAAAASAAAHAARTSYGRLVAFLAWQWRDVAAAEDAMATALERALATWPGQGVPQAPDAWLLAVARRELLQAARHARLHDSPAVQALLDGGTLPGSEAQAARAAAPGSGPAVPDERLKLLFVCAHPAIDAGIRPALMLQVVLGLQAQTIAQAWLTSPAAMAQRLVRAKQKIRDAGLRFEEPDAEDLPEREQAVLEAIYGAYGLGWDAVAGGARLGSDAEAGDTIPGDDAALRGLRAEALHLGELAAHLLPQSAEARGLLALMLYCEARVPARHDDAGAFVPLSDQDTRRWDAVLIGQAEALLRDAASLGAPGPFQVEAAIQSAHCQRLHGGATPWQAIAALYAQLLAWAPGLGAEVAHAWACAQAGDAADAAARLDACAAREPRRIASYQPWWVARAQVARLLGDEGRWRDCLQTAAGLTSSPAIRRHLAGQVDGQQGRIA